MNSAIFYKQLIYVTTSLAILTFLLQKFVPKFYDFAAMTWISIVFFVVFSWVVFVFGSKSARSENKNDFTRFSMMVIMGKLFLSIFLVIGYVYIVKPDNKLVVLPFIPIYIVYSIFETNFLMKLSKPTATKN